MTANVTAIVRIRDQAPNDAEALARMFESPDINDYGSRGCRPYTAADRLRTILAATETGIPGFQFGIGFGDSGFRKEFQDPWPDSANQVSHFLTAVGLSFDPGTVSQTFFGIQVRDWIGAPPALSDADVAIRLCIGHEKASDAASLVTALIRVRAQYAAATAADVQNFRQAEAILGSGTPLQLTAALVALRSIQVNPSVYGNSYQDLLLTLCGWRLGKMIKNGIMQTGAGVAAWIRQNISA